MASNAMFDLEVTSTTDVQGTDFLHGPLLRHISMNFSIVTKEEEVCFRRLTTLLQDTSCFFTSMLLPAILQSTVDSFPPFCNETLPLSDLIERLLPNLENELENDDDFIHDLNIRVVPHRFYRLLHDFVPMLVMDTLWDYNNVDVSDEEASTLVFSADSSPANGVSEGPAWEEQLWGAPSMSPQF